MSLSSGHEQRLLPNGRWTDPRRADRRDVRLSRGDPLARGGDAPCDLPIARHVRGWVAPFMALLRCGFAGGVLRQCRRVTGSLVREGCTTTSARRAGPLTPRRPQRGGCRRDRSRRRDHSGPTRQGSAMCHAGLLHRQPKRRPTRGYHRAHRRHTTLVRVRTR